MRLSLRALAAILCSLASAQAAAPFVPITALAFSPDGAELLSNGNRTVVIRSPHDGKAIRDLPCLLPKILAIAYAPDSASFAVAGGEPGVQGAAIVFDSKSKTERRRFSQHKDLTTAVAFDGEGGRLATASADHTVAIWKLGEDVNAAKPEFTLVGHAGPVLALAFNPTAKELVTGSADRSIKVWSTTDGALLRTLTHHSEGVQALVFRGGRAQPSYCISGANDRTVRVWQPSIGRMVRIIRKHEGPILALCGAPDGTSVYSAGVEGIIRQLDPDSDAVSDEWRVTDDWIYALAISPDGKRLASGDWGGSVKILSLQK